MSLQEKLDAALSQVNDHNSVIGGPDKTGYVEPTQFIQNLKLFGATSEERLKGFSYEEILDCMSLPPALKIKPIALAREVAKIFRGDEKSTVENRPISGKKADKMSLRELVEHYDSEESENAVGKRLKDISKGQKFIVFSSGRIVDVETTFKLLQEIKQGYPGRNDIEVNSEIKEVHVLGSLPDNFVDENPLYRNRPLRPDGTCDQTGRSWEGVNIRVRQLIRVAMEAGDLPDISIDKAHDILDVVVGDDAEGKLRKRYRKAAVEFDCLDKMGKLPTLKLVLKKGGGPNHPFDNPKKVEFNLLPILPPMSVSHKWKR